MCTLVSCIWRVAICIWGKNDQDDHIWSNQTQNEGEDILQSHKEDKNHPKPTLLHTCCNPIHLLLHNNSPNSNSHTPTQKPNNCITSLQHSFFGCVWFSRSIGLPHNLWKLCLNHGGGLCCFSLRVSLYRIWGGINADFYLKMWSI